MSPERRAAIIETNRALTAEIAAKLDRVKQRQRARAISPATPAELETGPHSAADRKRIRRLPA